MSVAISSLVESTGSHWTYSSDLLRISSIVAILRLDCIWALRNSVSHPQIPFLSHYRICLVFPFKEQFHRISHGFVNHRTTVLNRIRSLSVLTVEVTFGNELIMDFVITMVIVCGQKDQETSFFKLMSSTNQSTVSIKQDSLFILRKIFG